MYKDRKYGDPTRHGVLAAAAADVCLDGNNLAYCRKQPWMQSMIAEWEAAASSAPRRSCLCVCRSPVVGTGGVVRTGGAAGEIGSRATSGRSGRGWSCRFASPRPLAASSASSSSLFACQPRRPARPVDQRATWRTSQGKVRPGIAACVVSIRTAPGVDCCSNAPMSAVDRTELGVCMASRAVGAVETVGEAAVVGRRSSGERSEIVGWGVRCHLPPCTPERPRMRTRPTGSPHLQRTGSKVV